MQDRSQDKHRRRGWVQALAGLLLFSLNQPEVKASDEPAKPQEKTTDSSAPPLSLHERIDRLIEAGQYGKLAAPATDSEFVRRVWLDFVGVIPPSSEARAFLDDPSPYKRQRLIDRLIEMPEFARRLTIVFDLMLMERRRDQYVPDVVWLAYLRRSFLDNKPYDQLVREILGADGRDESPEGRARAKFILERDAEPNLLTRDVGRLFLGRDLQCAQCHDHVLYDDYKQANYYGLYAFFNRTYLAKRTETEGSIGEKADGDVTFKSVFKKKIEHKTGPRVLNANEVKEPPAPGKGQEYEVYPGPPTVKAIPVQSRRTLLAPVLTSGQVEEFNINIANRLWAMLMGRGLVHPLDLHHSDNPPSHPELLSLLGREFAALKFDLKAFLRELALTRTYGRSSEPPPDLSTGDLGPERFNVSSLRPMSPEQLTFSLLQATGHLAITRTNVEYEVFHVDTKLRDMLNLDATRKRMGQELVEDRIYERVKGNFNPFIQRFGAASGQAQDNTSSTVHQALFLANSGTIQGWVAPSGDNLVGRLKAIKETPALAEEMYLAVFTRRPMAEEREEVGKFLAERSSDDNKRTLAIQELVWALLMSNEFRFNH